MSPTSRPAILSGAREWLLSIQRRALTLSDARTVAMIRGTEAAREAVRLMELHGDVGRALAALDEEQARAADDDGTPDCRELVQAVVQCDHGMGSVR